MNLASPGVPGKPLGGQIRLGDALARRDEPDAIPSEAVAFLKALDPTGWHSLVRFDPTEQRPGPIGLTIPPGRWDLAEAFVADWAGRENLYFSVNEPISDAPNKKLLKTDIAAIRAIPADIDLPGANDASSIQALSDRVTADCAKLPAPTFRVDSGGGVQLHWRLSDKLPATPENQEWAENQARAIARELGGDGIGNIDRIMRLPGVPNIPTPGKRAKGRVERLAVLELDGGPTHTPGASPWHRSERPAASVAQRPKKFLVRKTFGGQLVLTVLGARYTSRRIWHLDRHVRSAYRRTGARSPLTQASQPDIGASRGRAHCPWCGVRQVFCDGKIEKGRIERLFRPDFGRYSLRNEAGWTDLPRMNSKSTTVARDDYEHRVLAIWKRLRDARGADSAYNLSHAGFYLDAARQGGRLFEEDRARLVDMLENAQANALTDLPAGITREDILRGFAAFSDMVQFWSEPRAERETWGDAAADAFAKARIFRNQCHNADLETQIADRAEKRRAAVVEGLRLVGLEIAPWAAVPTPAPRRAASR